MALFDLGKGIGKKQEQRIPIEQVVSMRQQGLTNNQIMETLQRDSFTTDQISDAMNQADIKEKIEFSKEGDNMEQPGFPSPPPEGQMPPGPGMEQAPPPMTPSSEYEQRERIEEVAEAIIDEKWSELLTNVQKIVDWKEKEEQRINALELQFKDIKDNFDKLHSAILEKVGEYDRHIGDVGTELKALEKVFQKVLPSFTENVHELSRISKEMKKK